MLKAILFDLDGTLVDTNELVLQSFKHTYRTAYNVEVEDAEIVKSFGEPLTTTLGNYDEKNVDNLLKIYRSFNEEQHDILAKEIGDSKEVLRELKRKGIRTAVVTSKRRAMTERGLKLFDLLQYLDVTITPEDTKEHKPQGEPASLACKTLGVSPDEALMVGDSPFDILCGKNAGCLTAVVKYTALDLQSILQLKPDYCFSTLRDILNLEDIKSL